ncbi:hypothetical protein GGU11DRAFT_750852, partial [Lentinula aff. detonsa]
SETVAERLETSHLRAAELEATIKRVEGERDDLKKNLTILEKAPRNTPGQQSEVSARSAALEAQVQALDSTVRRVTAERDTLENDVLASEEQVRKLQTLNETLQEDHSQVVTSRDTLVHENRALLAMNQVLSDSFTNLETEQEGRVSRVCLLPVTSFLKETQSVQSRFERLQQNHDRVMTKLQNAQQEAEARTTAERMNSNGINEELRELREEHARTVRKLAATKSREAELEKECDSCRTGETE